MELFTMDRNFVRQDTIDEFNSAIWTERYYGDSEVELNVPATAKMMSKLKEGTFLGLVGSQEPMILETQDIEGGGLKVTGTSLLVWLNNRFIRTSPNHEDRYWTIDPPEAPGALMMHIVYFMCIDGPYLDGSIPTGIPNPQSLKIPGLFAPAWDSSDPPITYAIPFGPVYDAIKELATTYEIGQQIVLASPGTGNAIAYRNYKGLNRTSSQTVNAPVRFSPAMDSLTDIKELHSMANFKTDVWSFAPSNPGDLATIPGSSTRLNPTHMYTGFDRRVQMLFCEDITTDMIDGEEQALVDILNTRAADELSNHAFVQTVDGEIVPTSQYKYGKHYGLGDIVELQGYSGVVQNARITEYIRSQDTGGEKAYPTVTVID